MRLGAVASARFWGSEMRAGIAIAVVALLLAGCTRSVDEHREVPTAGGPPSFLAQSFDATGTLLVGTPLGVYRSTDGGRTWHTTHAARLGGALGGLHAGLDDRLPRAAAGARQPLLRPHRRAQALALPRRQRARALLAAERQALRARPRHVLAPLRHARLRAYLVPAARARRCRISTRAIAAARAKGGAGRRLRGCGPRRALALGRRGRELVAPARRRQCAVGGDHAGALAARRRRAARAVVVGRLRRDVAHAAVRARRSSPRIRATTASGTRSPRTESCSSPPTAAAAGRAG